LPLNVELRDLALARTIDHVVATTGLSGTCTTLGEAPGTARLEGPEGGLDHRALHCEVTVAGAEAGAPPDRAEDRRPDPGATPEPPPTSAAPARPAAASAGGPLPATGGGGSAAGTLLVAIALASRGAIRRR
jgi:hypothetical protein